MFQVPDAPALSVDVDRALATQVGMTQREAANNVLVADQLQRADLAELLGRPAQQRELSAGRAAADLQFRFVAGHRRPCRSRVQRRTGQRPAPDEPVRASAARQIPLVISQLNIRPVFDVDADVQGRDLYSASQDIDKVIAANQPPAEKAMHVTLSGQVETMRESYSGLFSGIALAVVLVYLFLVINFQSWIDPLIVLMAVPFALCGVMWMLFLTQTHLSVPALMGTLMCIGSDHRQQHSGGELRQPAHGRRRHPLRRRGHGRLHPYAPGADDRRRHDSRHDADGARAWARAASRTRRWPARSSAACCSPPSPRWFSYPSCIACCAAAPAAEAHFAEGADATGYPT